MVNCRRVLTLLIMMLSGVCTHAMNDDQVGNEWWQQVWPGARHLLAPFQAKERSEIAEDLLLGTALYRDLPEVHAQIRGHAWLRHAMLLMLADQIVIQRGPAVAISVADASYESSCDPIDNIRVASQVLHNPDGYGCQEPTDRIHAALSFYLLPSIFDVAWLVDHPRENWMPISRLLASQQRCRQLLAQGIERWRQAGFSDKDKEDHATSANLSRGDDNDDRMSPVKRRKRDK